MAKGDYFIIAGQIVEVFPDAHILLETHIDLAIGDMVRLKSLSERISHEQVIIHLQDKEGQKIYKAKAGERVVFRPSVSLRPGDQVEKFYQVACLNIEALVDPKDICFLNGLFEGHDGMAVLRTLDGTRGWIEVMASPCYYEQVYGLIRSLQSQIFFEILK